MSIFRPYDRDAKHEDQLTRAALIVMKLVPLAHEAFLNLAGCEQLSALPRPRFDMQTEQLVPLSAAGADLEGAELVSIFLGPHEGIWEEQPPDLASERRARYDGVIQYGSRLIVVIESKLFATATEQQALKINTKGFAYARSRFQHVRWQQLLDRWWNLMDLGVLGPAEADVLSDFFSNAEENFGDLLPYTDLERCGDNPRRRVSRLRTILEQATGFDAEVRDVLGHAGVQFPSDQVIAFDRASLYVKDDDLVLSMWPAELAPQYKRVYSDLDRAEALIALTSDPHWEANANFHLSYWRASGPRRWYPARHLPGPVYIRQWLDDFKNNRAGRRPREEIKSESFRSWLVQRNYASESELESLDEWADKLPMEKFDVRPSIQLTRSWRWADAVVQDKAGKLIAEVQRSIDEALLALDEPRLGDLQHP